MWCTSNIPCPAICTLPLFSLSTFSTPAPSQILFQLNKETPCPAEKNWCCNYAFFKCFLHVYANLSLVKQAEKILTHSLPMHMPRNSSCVLACLISHLHLPDPNVQTPTPQVSGKDAHFTSNDFTFSSTLHSLVLHEQMPLPLSPDKTILLNTAAEINCYCMARLLAIFCHHSMFGHQAAELSVKGFLLFLWLCLCTLTNALSSTVLKKKN